MKTTQNGKTVRNSQKQQRVNAELELIIEEFGQAMRTASRTYITTPSACQHDEAPRFTMNMEFAWSRYVGFCMRNPVEKA